MDWGKAFTRLSGGIYFARVLMGRSSAGQLPTVHPPDGGMTPRSLGRSRRYVALCLVPGLLVRCDRAAGRGAALEPARRSAPYVIARAPAGPRPAGPGPARARRPAPPGP